MLPWLENSKWVNHHLNTKKDLFSQIVFLEFDSLFTGLGGGAVKEWNSLFKSNGLRSKLLAVTLCKQVSGLQRSPKPAPATPAPFLPPPSFCLPSAYTPLPSRCRESEQEKDREPVPGAGRSGAVGISLRGAGGTARRPRPLWLISSAFGSG